MNLKLTDNDGWTYEFINAAAYDKMFITSPHSGKTYAVDHIALSEESDGVFEFTFKDDVIFECENALKDAAEMAVKSPDQAMIDADSAIMRLLKVTGYKQIADLYLKVKEVCAISAKESGGTL